VFHCKWFADYQPGGRGPSARHKLLSDHPRVGYELSIFRGAVLFARLVFADCPLRSRRPSASPSQTVRLGLRSLPKSFAS
jgi:hypothetical protein